MVGLKITGLPIHGWRDDSLHMRQKRKKMCGGVTVRVKTS